MLELLNQMDGFTSHDNIKVRDPATAAITATAATIAAASTAASVTATTTPTTPTTIIGGVMMMSCAYDTWKGVDDDGLRS